MSTTLSSPESIVIPKRGLGRPTAAKAELYREQVKEFCRKIQELRANPRL
jgi:hypothetical protein